MIAAVAILVAGTIAVPSELGYFPGPYYDAQGREYLQQRALRAWPAPSALVDLWHDGTLDEPRRVALLLGAAAFHDPVLLTVYADAARHGTPRERQAAAYGYRDLLGDALPDVRSGVSEQDGLRLAREIRSVATTLERADLVELWLASALRADGVDLPDWSGVVLQRSVPVCIRGASVVARAEDLSEVIGAYRRARSLQARAQLLRLIEALGLRRFLVSPGGRRPVWRPDDVYGDGFIRLDRWLDDVCRTDDPRELLAAGFAELGLSGTDPFGADACAAWWSVLERGDPAWWSTAASQLYRCGAPYVELEVLQAESPRNRQRREILKSWHQKRMEEMRGAR